MVSALTYINATVLIVAATLFVAAAISDIRAYRIPNSICASLVLAFPLHVLTAPNPVDWKGSIIILGVVFAIGFACFLGNILGAGDVKFLSAASLWAGPELIYTLLIVTAFVGGIESLAATIARHIKAEKSNKPTRLIKTEIPYGVAIAAGGLTVLGMIAHPMFVQPG